MLCVSRAVVARGAWNWAHSARAAHRVGPAWRRGAYLATDARGLARHTDELHQETLRPINDRLLGPLQKEATQFPAMPVVFLLGNHSSGKSSFINFVLGEQVQKAGVAPTDDGFTIIAPGQQRLDQDGPALVGDPDLGFAGLRGFGTPLINHLHLKVRGPAAVIPPHIASHAPLVPRAQQALAHTAYSVARAGRAAAPRSAPALTSTTSCSSTRRA